MSESHHILRNVVLFLHFRHRFRYLRRTEVHLHVHVSCIQIVPEIIALDDEGSSEDRNDEESEGEGGQTVAREGMVPIGVLREVE